MPNNQNSLIFLDLATLLAAGISVLDAAKRVYQSYPQMTSWQLVIRSLEKGVKLSLALKQSGLTNRFENEVISIAEDAGRLEQGLTFLSDSHQKRNSRVSRLRVKLYYPLAILVVGIIVSGILTIANNPSVSIIAVLLRLLAQLGVSIFLTHLLLKQLNRDACYWLSKLQSFEHKSWYKVQFQQLVFETLYWHISSGIDPKSSLNRISGLVNTQSLRKRLVRAANYCDQGSSINSAIRRANLPITSEMIQILHSAEQSGELEQTLKNQLALNQQQAELTIDNLYEWLPRTYFALVVVFSIISLI